MITSMVSVKIVSLIVGPAGIAFIGQLNNFSSIIYNLACGGIHSGVTKYVAENKQNISQVNSYISTSFKITLFSSALIGIVLVCLHNKISRLIMLSSNYGYIFVILGITVFCYALNNLFISILSGYNEYRKYISINIATNVVSLIFTIILVWLFKLKGALISIVTFQSVILFLTLWMIRKDIWVNRAAFFSKVDQDIIKKYSHYALMNIAAISILPVFQILLRRYVIVNISAVEAGWWEGMNKISSVITNFIWPFLNLYYLPRLSQSKTRKDIRNEMLRIYKLIMPILAMGLMIIYIFRLFMIRLLFTANFSPMEILIKWQLLGDLFRIAVDIFGFILVAKKMTKIYIALTVLCPVIYFGTSFVLVRINGIVGMVQGYLIYYIVNFLIVIFVFRNILFGGADDIV
jgi:PST family polysaccharide transporter